MGAQWVPRPEAETYKSHVLDKKDPNFVGAPLPIQMVLSTNRANLAKAEFQKGRRSEGS